MADTGIRGSNLPISFAPVDVIALEDLGNGRRRTARSPVSSLANALVAAAVKVTVANRDDLDPLLDYPADTGAEVVDDPVESRRGVYRKNGPPGTGGWTRIAPLRPGPAGAPGPANELRVFNGNLQYRTVGTSNWITLVALTDLGVSQATIDALEALVADKASQDDLAAQGALLSDLQALLDGYVAAPPPSARRPADGLTAYTFATSVSALSGESAFLPPLTPERVVMNASGAAIRLAGPGIVASREAYSLEAGRIMAVRVSVSRAANASDPNNDAVRFGGAWLDQAKQVVGSSVIVDFNALTTGSGREVRTGYISASAGAGITLVAPPNAAYFRPFVQNFGADGLTDVETLAAADVTGQTIPPAASATMVADVAALKAQNAGERLNAAEAALNAPNSVTYATRTDAAAASPTVTITTILTRGDLSPGDGRGALWRRATQAEALAAVTYFRSANGSYWARVDEFEYDQVLAPQYAQSNFWRLRADQVTFYGSGSSGPIQNTSVLPDDGEIGRRLGEITRDAINVCDHRLPSEPAVNSNAINRAIYKAWLRGGGRVIIPNIGVAYNVVSPIRIMSNVELIGMGRPVLRLADGVNDNVIEGYSLDPATGNFETYKDLLYGTQHPSTVPGNNGRGPSNWAIIGIIVDGNRDNNTAPVADGGHGIAVHGRNFVIEDVFVRFVRRRGVHTRYGNTQVGGSPFNGRVSRLTTSECGEEGWFNEVSDLHFNNVNARTSSLNEHNKFDAVRFGSPGSVRGMCLNVWRGGGAANTHSYSLYIEGACVITGAHLETAATANLYLSGGGSALNGIWGYNLAAGAVAGSIIAGNNNVLQVHYNPSSAAEAAVAMQIGEAGNAVSGNDITLRSVSARGGCLNFVASNGNNLFRINEFADAGAGALDRIQGSPSNSDQIYHYATGTNAGADCRFGGQAKGAIRIGRSSVASGVDSTAIGQNAGAFSDASQAWGKQVRTFNPGEMVWGVGQAKTQGDRQIVQYVRWGDTTSAAVPTPVTTLNLLTTAGGGTISLPVSTILTGRWTIIGSRSDGPVGTYKAVIDATIRRGTSGGVTLPENVRTQVIGYSGDAAVSVALTADGTTGAIALTVTGSSAAPVAWMAVFDGAMIRW